MTKTQKSSDYIEQQRKNYALYVIQNRALVSICDGLKTGGRRVLWMARKGDKEKTATLAGATMPIHPHQEPSGAINTLTAPYGNNIPLFDGYGAFGTLLAPTSYGHARYTSVKLSQFTKDVVLADIELIEMIDNYDQTRHEPKNFLPLIPLTLLNPSEGIAVGFASTILPRSLSDIIKSQITFLNGKAVKDVMPEFYPFDSKAYSQDKNGKWLFQVSVNRINSFEVKITHLPYNTGYAKLITRLDKLLEAGTIKDYEDSSSDEICVVVKFPRGYLATKTDLQIQTLLELTTKVSENFNVLDFAGLKVLVGVGYVKTIEKFTKWRLRYYKQRYKRLLKLQEATSQKYRDIILAIKNDIGKRASTLSNRATLKMFIKDIGVVNVDYIADLPIYRFTVEERDKVKQLLDSSMKIEKEMSDIISSPDKLKDIYINELKTIQSNFKKGKYSTI